ncbi:hypothetical protein WG904_10820 [Pedobacter sp. Du54]|uniref:hypothetical protein n=1 Tax=Pedobacter anseongensis TaxID=3133439 RepID=UPI0030B5B544
MKSSIYLCLILIASSFKINAQTNSLVQKIDNYQKIFPKEIIYLSFDKPNYKAGDTLWFKSFLLNADHTASLRTDKIYVELFNDSSQFVGGRAIALNYGLGYGDFALKKDLPNGTYTIRAYSNWQQNFESDYFFQKSFSIGNVGEHTWLLNAYQKVKTINKKQVLDLKVRLSNMQNESAGLRDVEIYLMDNRNILTKAEFQTSQNGLIETQIPLPDFTANSNYSLYFVDKKDKNKKATLPIILDEVDKLDLQFMPEGGYMVNGIYGRVAFKAIGANGVGVKISGKVINSKNETVAHLSTTHNGMGSFYLLPQKDETYAVSYTFNGKKEERVDLPAQKNEGTTLRIDHLSKPDSLLIYVKASESKREEQNYQLIAQTTGGYTSTLPVNLKNGFATFKLPKNNYPDGIVHFTLFSPKEEALNERQAFLNFNKKLAIQVKTENDEYNPRDSIALTLSAFAENALPVSSTFSISVTDDQQVKQNTNDNTILSYFLLQSEIKGNIEDAAWYFDHPDSAKFSALDHLLLTQGWVGYKWNDILKTKSTPAFKAEKGNLIEGKVLGFLNKPLPNMNLKLLALGKTMYVADTVTNKEGKFLFKDLPILDSVAYSIKIKNAKGNTTDATIIVDEFTAAKDNITFKPLTPWYVNSDSTTLLNYFKLANQRKLLDQSSPKMDGNMLKEVEIQSKARESEFVSKTAWDARFYKKISKEELEKNPRKKLIDLLKEQLPGFGIGVSWSSSCVGRYTAHKFYNYVVGSRLVSHVMIDKVNTHMVATGIDDNFNQDMKQRSMTDSIPDVFPINQFIFTTLNAEDVVDIVVYKGCSYFYLDITTRSGKGPWIAPAKGIYVHKPLPIYMAKEFYSPKYSVTNHSSTPDLRSTLFWDANVVADENGKAKLSFYAADKPGTYTIRVEGTDMLGRFGYYKGKITIKNKTESK